MILITGASSGIGKALAYSYASKSFDLFITSRNINILNEIKDDLEKTYNIKVITCKCDLTITKDIYNMFNEAIKYNIEVVINNSGVGIIDEFYKSSDTLNQNLIDLNMTSATITSKLFCDYFKTKNKGIIINVSSIGAYVSGSYMSLYYASKCYLLNLTKALSYELAPYNIKVKALIPTTTNTNFFNNLNKDIKGMDVSRVCKTLLKNTFNNKKVIVVGFKSKLMIFLLRFLPSSLVTYFMEKALRKRLK